MQTTIRLYLKDHCIETAAKNLFKKMMDDYFSIDDENGEIENKIDLLRDFIEKSDFGRLRASDERLNGHIKTDISLARKENGEIEISIRQDSEF